MAESDNSPRNSQDAATTPIGVTTLCPQCGASMPAFETRCSSCGHQLQANDNEQRDALRRRLQAGIGDAYELVQLIGKGGMGVVFRAKEKALDRDVALKVLAFDPMLVPEAFMRFEREAKLAARLDHPNIVPIFAVGQGHGIAFYTMRLVRGGSLEELLTAQRKLEPARAIRYLREISAALDHAHAHGIVHRDIKPANIMLGEADHVLVADFGIARAVGGEAGALTSTGVVGSPAYMAPEQWQGQGIDGRADQYALGILAYELLTGKRPYRDASMHELLRLHLMENLPDITQELPSMSGQVREVLARATAKDPTGRYATTAEFVNELERAVFSRATPAQNAETIVGVSIKPPPSIAVPATSGAKTVERNRTIPIVALLVVGVAGAVIWGATQQSETTVPPVTAETIRVQTPAETVRLNTKAAPETVRVPPPISGGSNVNSAANSAANAASGAATAVGAGAGAAARGDSGGLPVAGALAGPAYIAIAHPLTMGNRYQIDGVPVAPRLPPVYEVKPGRHVVTFQGATPTIPPQLMLAVKPGDTVRALFAPAAGGGARGEQLRQQVFERARRMQQQNPQRGGLRGGRGVRGDTLN